MMKMKVPTPYVTATYLYYLQYWCIIMQPYNIWIVGGSLKMFQKSMRVAEVLMNSPYFIDNTKFSIKFWIINPPAM